MIILGQVLKKTTNNSSYLIWGVLKYVKLKILHVWLYRAFWVKKKKPEWMEQLSDDPTYTHVFRI